LVAIGDPGLPPPIVVLGIGGSGTRLVAEMLIEAGVFLGTRRNRAADAQVIGQFLRRSASRYLDESRWIETLSRDPEARLPGAPERSLVDEFKAALAIHLEEIPSPGMAWGWKNPRTVYVLPALHSVVRGARVVQLVRDGRDIAYSRNQNQLEVYGERLVGDLADYPGPVRSAALWSRVNLAAYACGRRLGGDAHLVVRYEELCERPAAEARRLLAGVGLPADDDAVERAAALASVSPSAGRWRHRDPKEIARIEEIAGDGLRRFGYLDG